MVPAASSPDTRWGLFPSVAFAWRMSEGFFKDIQALSFLKLRLAGYYRPAGYLQ